MFDERARMQFGYCLAKLFLCIHHDWAVPRNRLFDWLAGYQQETDSFATSLDDDLISAVKEHERVIVDVVDGRGVRINDLIRKDRPRIRGVTERAGAREDVSESVARRLDLEPLAKAGW